MPKHPKGSKDEGRSKKVIKPDAKQIKKGWSEKWVLGAARTRSCLVTSLCSNSHRRCQQCRSVIS